MQLDEVQAFFRRYYHPANASLAIAGDIDPGAALALARDYFGEIEPGPRVDPIAADTALPADVRILLEDRVELPRIYISWLSPAMFAAGDADLDRSLRLAAATVTLADTDVEVFVAGTETLDELAVLDARVRGALAGVTVPTFGGSPSPSSITPVARGRRCGTSPTQRRQTVGARRRRFPGCTR